jgi:serine phosphatase RsbU (regulator of sigma subunit)
VSVGRDEVHFSNFNIQLEKGDIIYMFSDGYADQNGGPNKKKFMRGNVKKLLSGIYEKSLDEQKTILEDTFMKWKGDEVQVDDILFMGLKV